MSSERDDQDEPTPPWSQASEEGSEALVDTIECPACGRRFVGTYCPDCGQEAAPLVSTGGVLEDFAREFLDIEQGFLETVWALTVAPGPALQAYLSGDRNRLMSPGRYLLATLVVQYVVIRGLIWTGALVAVRPSAIVEPSGLLSDAAPSTLTQTVATLLQFVESQEGQIVTYLAVVGLFTLLLRLLFHEQLRRRPDALVLSSFLVGHAVLLETTVHLAWVPPTRLLSGTPVSPVSRTLFSVFFGVAFAVFLGYVGWATYQYFGPGPRSVAKGLLGATWALVEAEALFGLAGIGYISWLAWGNPDAYPVDGATLAGLGGLCAVPLLLHAGIAAYDRLR
jgi:hypothetical protein